MRTNISNNSAAGAPLYSLIARSAALFAVLYQFRLVAGELADTDVFIVILFTAFAAAAFLAYRKISGIKINAFVAVAVIGLIPWVIRGFIAMPRFFIPGRADALAVTLDSFLLNYDRNNFVSLLPFYWAAVTTFFSIKSRGFLRAAVIADAVLLIIFFSIARASDVEAYRWPVVMILIFASIIFLQALSLLFSLPPEFNLKKKETITAVAAFLLLAFLGGLIFLNPAQARAAERGGGLLEPRLFSFDFSQVLRLEPEITMTDDLVMIVRKEFDHQNILLRRSVMSGFNRRQGFFRIEELDERNHPHRLPARTTTLSPPEFNLARRVRQEYFLVNFDAAAFFGMKEPVKIIPFENWDESSFRSAFAVESLVSDASMRNLLESVLDENGVPFWPGLADFGLTEREFAIYTEYGGDQRIRAFAEEVTAEAGSYTEKVLAVFHRLRYGEFLYSLRPGIAPDGDQLAWFLFHSRRGYCSYFAFAMTLMLRSLGIPARVAAGFFIDPGMRVFDYFPIRADMAHAWVEVLFPGYGWIEFDPTTENLAADEEFQFSSGVDPDLFERLMREILENRGNLRERTGAEARDAFADPLSLIRRGAEAARKILLPVLLILLIITFALIRCGFLLLSVICNGSGEARQRARSLLLWKHTKQRLRLAGLGRPSSLTESEWALQCEKIVSGTYSMYLNAAAARFAPVYQTGDLYAIKNAYSSFSESYRKSIGRGRRILAWILPPLALFLRAKSGSGFRLALLLLFVFLAGAEAQNGEANSFENANELYRSAMQAEFAEHWERAITLYMEGNRRFPDDFRFPRSLGNLYYHRSLYNLALAEFRKAELINPFNINLLLRMASAAARLNLNRTAVGYLERVLAIDGDNREAISHLGWMYFKVHRLHDGERLLLSAIERLGDDAELSMTLGTIYSNMYRYEDARYWYLKSIALAESVRGFVAVAYYNLSILESRFRRHALSLEAANASLDSQIRASGFIARADLYMRRLDLPRAQSDYNAAREIDPSPLSRLNLAHAFRVSGRLEEARLYALSCLRATDHSWMANYGIDPVRYKRDIYEILFRTYSGLLQAERFVPRRTLGERFSSFFRSVSLRFYTTVYRKLHQKYSLAAGNAFSAELLALNNGEGIDSPLFIDPLIQYYNAFRTFPRRAATYLNRARSLEVPLIPEAEPSYILEEGILLNDIALIKKALDALDPVWERGMISRGFQELARSGFPVFSMRARAARRDAAERLFALNRGALLQSGIRLPAEIRINFANEAINTRRNERTMRNALSKAGFSPGTVGGVLPRYRLEITINETPAAGFSVSSILIDEDGELQPLHRTIPLPSLSRRDIYDFAGSLSRFVFRVE